MRFAGEGADGAHGSPPVLNDPVVAIRPRSRPNDETSLGRDVGPIGEGVPAEHLVHLRKPVLRVVLLRKKLIQDSLGSSGGTLADAFPLDEFTFDSAKVFDEPGPAAPGRQSAQVGIGIGELWRCLLYTSPSPRDS